MTRLATVVTCEGLRTLLISVWREGKGEMGGGGDESERGGRGRCGGVIGEGQK